jgi:hypothetical protein
LLFEGSTAQFSNPSTRQTLKQSWQCSSSAFQIDSHALKFQHSSSTCKYYRYTVTREKDLALVDSLQRDCDCLQPFTALCKLTRDYQTASKINKPDS